jgi:aminopeptidase N
LHHQVQLQVIRSLFARDERLGVGMEMFQRPYQKDIDRYFRGETMEEDFLKATEYRERWGFDWSLYRPIAEFCRKNSVPLAALNVPRELTRRLSKVGHKGLTDDEKQQLGEVDFHVKAHRDYWYERLAKMHGQKDVPEEQKEKSYQVMTAWDEYMGASAALFQKERRLRRLVVLAGSGHIERGFGIPARAVKRTGGKVATLRVEVGGDLDKVLTDPAADFVLIVK